MEIWKDIPEYEGLYKISTNGTVASYDRIVEYYGGRMAHRKGKILKERYDRYGYKRVELGKNGKNKTFSIHRLVALTFIPNLENKPQVNHINGVKDDNHVENLEWSTSKENINHAYKNKLMHAVKGEQHYKYGKEALPQIKEALLNAAKQKKSEEHKKKLSISIKAALARKKENKENGKNL